MKKRKCLFSFAGHDSLVDHLGQTLGLTVGEKEIHPFPDGETLVKVNTDCSNAEVFVLANLHHPDAKFLSLCYLTDAIRDRGARKITLIAPYLPYMRQDTRFEPGQALTSAVFARLLSGMVDELVTVDPHLHRYHSLEEIYSIPCQVLSAMPLVSEWIRQHIRTPLIIGPDSESEQWARTTAESVGCDYLILEKHRYGDRNVEVDMPPLEHFKNHTPVLVDDIISTGRTMIKTAEHLKEMGLAAPVCIGVHGVFSKTDYQALRSSYVSRVVTCDTIEHETNSIAIEPLLGTVIGKTA